MPKTRDSRLEKIDYDKPLTKKQSGATAVKTNPALWEQSKARAREKMGGHSARAMQLAVKYYKSAGGTYSGQKSSENKLVKWTREDWGNTGRKGSRYLPRKARDHLSTQEKKATNAKKRKDTKAGKQFSRQPRAIAAKTAKYRS